MDFSIIIPVYNTPPQFLSDCLGSISESKIRYSYEVIIINDGSTNPDTLAFLESIHDPKTTIIHNENKGVSATRNIGMRLAKGRVILCLDSDDKLLPEINTALQNFTDAESYDIAYCDMQFFGDTDYYYKKGKFNKFQQIYLTHLLIPSGALIKKKIAENFCYNELLDYSEDKDFFARIAAAGHQFLYLPKPFFLYRRLYNNHSLSQKNAHKREETENFIKSQFHPHTEITLDEVNKYVVKNFKTSPKNFIKMIIVLFFPKIFNFLKKKNIYKNDIVID